MSYYCPKCQEMHKEFCPQEDFLICTKKIDAVRYSDSTACETIHTEQEQRLIEKAYKAGYNEGVKEIDRENIVYCADCMDKLDQNCPTCNGVVAWHGWTPRKNEAVQIEIDKLKSQIYELQRQINLLEGRKA